MLKEKFKRMYYTNKKHMIIQSSIFISVLTMLIGAIIYMLFFHPNRPYKVLFIIAQMIMMLAVIIGTVMFENKFKIDIPDSLETMYVVFAFCGFILGDVFDFYGKFRHWDSILHTFSGVILAYIAYVIIDNIVKSQKFKLELQPIYLSIFSVMFALSFGALWEIGEYIADDLFGLNSQQYMMSTSTTFTGEEDIPLVGHEALRDTMKDLILDTAGAVVVATTGYVVKTKKEKVSHL